MVPPTEVSDCRPAHVEQFTIFADGESTTWMRKVTLRQKSESRSSCSKRSGPQPESEDVGEVGGLWIVGNVVELDEGEEGSSSPWCRSKHWASEDRCDEVSMVGEENRDEFRKIRGRTARCVE